MIERTPIPASFDGDQIADECLLDHGRRKGLVTGTILGDDGLARPAWASVDPLLRAYYGTEWGMPVVDEHGVYERITLEAFQAELSWATILRKRPAFRTAFDDFDPDKVAAYSDADVERLLANTGIVRNRAKILAAITNARATILLRDEGGSPTSSGHSKPPRHPSRAPSMRSPPNRMSRLPFETPGRWNARGSSPSRLWVVAPNGFRADAAAHADEEGILRSGRRQLDGLERALRASASPR